MILPRVRAVLNYVERLFLDALLSGGAFFTVTMLPLSQSRPGGVMALLPSLGIYMACSLCALYAMRTYRTIWRYTSFRDFLGLTAAALMTLIGFMIIELAIMEPNLSVPGTLLAWTIVLLAIVNIGFLAAPRFVVRALDEAR